MALPRSAFITASLFILLYLLARRSSKAVAIDLFEDQHLNIDEGEQRRCSRSSASNAERHADSTRLVLHQSNSMDLSGAILTRLAEGPLRFVSVDGGHTAEIMHMTWLRARRRSPRAASSWSTTCSASNGRASGDGDAPVTSSGSPISFPSPSTPTKPISAGHRTATSITMPPRPWQRPPRAPSSWASPSPSSNSCAHGLKDRVAGLVGLALA